MKVWRTRVVCIKQLSLSFKLYIRTVWHYENGGVDGTTAIGSKNDRTLLLSKSGFKFGVQKVLSRFVACYVCVCVHKTNSLVHLGCKINEVK